MGARRRCRGIALTWTAIIVLVLVLMVGLSIDVALAAVAAHQMHNAADAAALAGAQVVKFEPVSTVIQRAYDVANENSVIALAVDLRTTQQQSPFVEADEDLLDIVLGRWIRHTHEFYPTLDAPNAVKAVVRRNGTQGNGGPISLLFGPMVGADTVGLERHAVAWSFSASGAGLIALSSSANPGLYIGGNGVLDIENGGIHVNSTLEGEVKQSAAVHIDGTTAVIDTGEINIVGGGHLNGSAEWEDYFWGDTGDGVEYHPFTINEGPPVEPIPDPLQSLRDNPPVLSLGMIPTYPDGVTPILETIDDQWIAQHGSTIQPGYYPGGIDTSSTSLTLTGGYYYLGGSTDGKSGLVTNGGDLIGNGVTLYVTKGMYPDGYLEKNPDGSPLLDGLPDLGAYGKVDLQGNGTIQLVSIGDAMEPPQIDGEIGVAIWQDPDNPNSATFNGTGEFSITGTLYFPDPIHVDIEGTPDQAGNQIIAGSVAINGRAPIEVDYDGRNNLKSYKSVLVD